MLCRSLLCFAVLHLNVLNVAALLDTPQHLLEATEENHEDVRNVYCFGVSGQLKMFPLAEEQRLNCRMVADALTGRCQHTSTLVFEALYIPLVLTPFWHAPYP